MRELPEGTLIEKAEFVFSRHFMGMDHNYLCAVCKTNSGIQDCHSGILQPCWKCQKKYRVMKVNWLTRLFGGQSE